MTQKDILTALGPLAHLYEDPRVLEIMVDAPDQVYVDREDKIVDTGITFASPEALREVIDAVLSLGGVTLTEEQTSGHVRLPDGTRLMAVLPPTAVGGPHMVIRKISSIRFGAKELFEFGSITPEAHALLQSAIYARQNILVAGGTGSGKTTFANILTDEYPDDERVIVIESVYELQPRVERFIRLSADNSPDHSFTDLVVLAAKMRPDRLIFGEFRGAEAVHALNLINTGHDGSLATIHAADTEDALARLETMCLMANLGVGLSDIRRMIASAMQLLIYQQRLKNGRRKVTQITELRGLENDRYVLQPLFRHNFETDRLEPTGAKPSWEE